MIYKTFWPRVAAAFIDTLLLWPLLIIQTNKVNESLGLVSVTILVLQHSYYIIGHAQYGRTLGKRLLGLKVVRTHQQLPLTWKHAFMRESLWIVVSIIYSIPYFQTAPEWTAIPGFVIVLGDAFTALIHPQNRSIRDFIAKTVVIRSRL
jgi:uncharacterized RDD family membrane protein YckC